MANFNRALVVVLLTVAILVDSATVSTTKRPRSRKVLTTKIPPPSPSNSSSSASADSKNPQNPVRPLASANARRNPAGARMAVAPPGVAQPNDPQPAVRRNPASVDLELANLAASQPLDSIDPNRLREDMAQLGLNEPLNLDDNLNNLNVMDRVESPARQPPAVQSYQPQRRPQFNPYDYEDMLFDDYDQPLQDNKLLAESTPSDRYLKSEVCGRKLYCQRGNRGPCNRNEVFLPQTNVTNPTTSRPSCANLLSYPWTGCFQAGKVGVANAGAASTGSCSLRFPQRPCYGYPPNYRYSVQMRRCYPSSNSWDGRLGSAGPCPFNKVFMDIDGINGMCQCRDRNQLLYKGDDKCHRIYAKGPCGAGQWLEPDTNGYGVCRRSPCPENKCDGRHIYWKPTPNGRGGCYKSFTRGPCRRGSYFLVDDYGTRRGRCVSQFGSSFNPLMPYATPSRYPMMRNSYDSMYSNNMMSPWSRFGMYPPYGMQDYDQDYDDSDPSSFDY